MNKMNELSDMELDSVFGGSIDYRPNGSTSKSGVIGLNKSYTHKYDNEDALISYVSAHINDKVWSSPAERDQYLFQGLIDAGIIY